MATPDVLLAIVAKHPALQPIHGNDRWAQSAGALLARKLCRASDAEAAVESFMLKNAHRESWTNVDDLCSAIGGYLANAKSHGDQARARQERSAPGRNGAPAIQRGNWTRDQAETSTMVDLPDDGSF